MKISSPDSFRDIRRGSRGILLVECVVYLALFFVVVGMAFVEFYSCWDNARGFRRTTDQIVSTMRVGENWRGDVRSATGPLRLENSADGKTLHIPNANGEVDYRFAKDALWRRAGAEAEWIEVLPQIKTSLMAADARRQVTAWRWELELKTRRSSAHVIPLFTFEAVPQPKD